MGPLIDAELEAVDRRHAQLTRLSTELVDALNLYHQLMHENIQGGYGMPMPNGGKFISINLSQFKKRACNNLDAHIKI